MIQCKISLNWAGCACGQRQSDNFITCQTSHISILLYAHYYCTGFHSWALKHVVCCQSVDANTKPSDPRGALCEDIYLRQLQQLQTPRPTVCRSQPAEHWGWQPFCYYATKFPKPLKESSMHIWRNSYTAKARWAWLNGHDSMQKWRAWNKVV